MKVVEIFKSIDGEGTRAGFPVTFIRLEGCNLRCSYCDTKYSYEDAKYAEMTPEEVYMTVYDMKCKRVTITGGEPLIHEDIENLIMLLTADGFEVNIETNGSVNISPYSCKKNVIVTMDYKCPSSGVEDRMMLSNLRFLRPQDVIKFVVGSKEDLDKCRELSTKTNAQVFISPVFGMIEPKDIVEYMLENGMNDCRVQLQLHKFIWPVDMRGV